MRLSNDAVVDWCAITQWAWDITAKSQFGKFGRGTSWWVNKKEPPNYSLGRVYDILSRRRNLDLSQFVRAAGESKRCYQSRAAAASWARSTPSKTPGKSPKRIMLAASEGEESGSG